MAFEESTGLLMSGKFFSAHLCSETFAEANRSSTEEDRRYFYDCLMAPMARQVETVVERLEELDIRTIAPGHGPAIADSWRSLLNDYRRWGEGQQRSKLSVALLFQPWAPCWLRVIAANRWACLAALAGAVKPSTCSRANCAMAASALRLSPSR